MTIDSEDFIFVPEADLEACPFIGKCVLRKLSFLCKVSRCEESCPEYIAKYEALDPYGNSQPKI